MKIFFLIIFLVPIHILSQEVDSSDILFLKIQELDSYKSQRRGGVGKSSTAVRQEDYAKQLYIANRHDSLLCFSNKGRLYWLKLYQLPLANRTSKGRPIVNYLPLQDDEEVTALMPVTEFEDGRSVVMVTKLGVIKQVDLASFSRPRQGGIIAVSLDEGDSLMNVLLAKPSEDVMIFSSLGKVIRFSLSDVRVMGRGARGVRSMRLKENDFVVSAIIANEDYPVLTVATDGMGKRTKLSDFRKTGRGGQGVIAINLSENARVISAAKVSDDEDIFLITDGGTLVRIGASSVSIIGRSTKGVRLIRLKNDEQLVAAQVFASEEDEAEDSAESEITEANE